MANIFLAWQNRTDEGILSGGSWLSSLPLTNLQNRTVQKVARSANATRAATQFDIDLQSSRVISALALVVHNISVNGYVRVRGGESVSAFSNLVSQDFSNAAWNKTNITVTANNSAAPDGTNTATRIAATATASTTLLNQQTATGTTATFTIFVKQGTSATVGNDFTIRNSTTGTSLLGIDLNLATGAFAYTFGSSGASVVACPGNWWCITLTASTGITAGNSITFLAAFWNSNQNAADHVFLWEPQIAFANGALYESGWQQVWPAGIIPQELLEWEDDNFWLGTLTQEQRAGYQSPYILRISSLASIRYWRIEISDTTNAAGYVQLGRLFMARGWTPSVNYTYGAGLGYQDPTPVDTSFSGAEYFDVRSRFRVMQFRLEYISDPEAYNYALDLQRVAGISGEVLVMPDGGENLGQQPLRSFVGRLRQISPVVQPQPSTFSVDFEVKELL